MSDLGTTAQSDAGSDTPRGDDRGITPWRGLPGGRAVVGAFLVTAATVGLFATYLTATRAPDDRYAVANENVPTGARLDGSEFRFVAIDLPEAQAARALPESGATQLEGLTTAGPLTRDDLLVQSDLVDRGGSGSGQLSLAVSPSRSLGDQLSRGERIDVLATYPGEGGRAYTIFVARGMQLLDITTAGGELGDGSRVLTVSIENPTAAASLAHAVTQAELLVTRSAATPGPLPDAYVPPGPAPALGQP